MQVFFVIANYTITDGANLQFTGLPFFAPEMFMTVVLKNPLRTKQLQQGLAQLGEEGAIQVFKPDAGGNMLLGAVGQLQFEVVAHRLEHEYGVKARIMPARYNVARWVTCEDPKELQRFIDGNAIPDFHGRTPHASLGGRSLCAAPFDGRRLGPHIQRMKPPLPETMLWGMLLMAMCFWMYSIAVAFMRVRTIMLERERHTDWVRQLGNAAQAGDSKA